MPTPQSNNEELLAAIINGTSVSEVPQSRMEKIWQYALGATVELDAPQSRIEELAIQVAEEVRNGGGTQPTGTISITDNGTYDVTEYAEAAVAVPQPTGTISITDNGTVNVAAYASASVNVPTSQDYTREDGMVTNSNLGAYENPRVTGIAAYAFHSLTSLTSASFPAVTYIFNFAFFGCSNLVSADFPALTYINAQCFNSSGLTTLNLYSPNRTTIPTLGGTNALVNTPIARGTGHIVINDELVDTLKAATNWSTYANAIIGHTDAISQGIISA